MVAIFFEDFLNKTFYQFNLKFSINFILIVIFPFSLWKPLAGVLSLPHLVSMVYCMHMNGYHGQTKPKKGPLKSNMLIIQQENWDSL